MPFVKGQSGNPSGVSGKAKPFRDALRMEMLAAENGEESVAHKGSLRWNARQLLERGDPVAIRELADRLDGKVPTPVTGADDGPIEHEMAFRWLMGHEKSSSRIYRDPSLPDSTSVSSDGEPLSPTDEQAKPSPV